MEKPKSLAGIIINEFYLLVENEIQKDNYSLFKLVQIINSVNLDFGEDLRFWNMNTKDDMTDIFNYLSDKK